MMQTLLNHPQQDAAAPGRFKYLDANGDGKITDADRIHFGNPNPKYTAGLNIGLTYKNFDFTTFFYACMGNDIYNDYKGNNNAYGSRSRPKLLCMIHGHRKIIMHRHQSRNSIIVISALPVHGILTRLKKVLI